MKQMQCRLIGCAVHGACFTYSPHRLGTNMRLLVSTALLVCVTTSALAHHPDRENTPVTPRIEVIPPLGTSMKMSHRRKYNRPSNWGGKIMYYIAPSSQEAMAWHSATHRGLYENDRPRIVTHYFYPKPWEAMVIGPRPRTTQPTDLRRQLDTEISADDIAPEAEPIGTEPAQIGDEDPLALPLEPAAE